MPNGGNFILGATNVATAQTILWKWAGGDYELALQVTCDEGIGIQGYGPDAGVVGNAHLDARGTGVGVSGYGRWGVIGTTDGGEEGVRGENTEGAAVAGYSTGPFGSGTGVFGFSQNYHGVIGVGGTDWGNGVYGYGSSGVVGQSQSDGPTAFGVFAWGKLGATGAKHAAVPHADGWHRLLYSMESPDCWFEDFGTARLKRGVARVAMPRDFADVVHTTRDYHVFVTPCGECAGLCVAKRSSRGFEVRELGGGASNVEFSFRIIARRKDIAAPRMPKVKLRKPEVDTRPRKPVKKLRLPPIRSKRGGSGKSQRS